jgi:thiol-disulfide isomerase/thioredoxin
MKKLFSLTLFLFLALYTEAEGIEFFHGTFEEAKALAKKENKLIFIDCYTTWCGPCKSLSKFVFTDPDMGAFYNENFINLKLDMEAEGRLFAIEYGISAYPTLLYIDALGTVRKRIVGGRDAKTFIEEGKAAMKPDENYIRKLMERFDNGDRETEFLKSYTRSLSKAEKSFEVPLREYLFYLSEEKKKEPSTTDFIFDIANHIQSKATDILLKEKALYIERYSNSNYEKKLLTIAISSAKDATKNLDETSFNKSIKFLGSLPASEKEKTQESLRLQWDEAKKDWYTYCKRAGKYYDKYLKNDSTEFSSILQKIDRTPLEANALKPIEKPAKSFAGQYPSFSHQLIYTKLLVKMGKIKEAESNMQKLTAMANQDQLQEIDSVRMRIQHLKNNGKIQLPTGR